MKKPLNYYYKRKKPKMLINHSQDVSFRDIVGSTSGDNNVFLNYHDIAFIETINCSTRKWDWLGCRGRRLLGMYDEP